MQKFKNWLISRLLKKDKLVAVPESWQVDYVKLAAAKVKNGTALQAIMLEYNELLQDYYAKCSTKELSQMCKDAEIKVKATASKEVMANMLYQEFRMTYEKE